jgi:TonB family protein
MKSLFICSLILTFSVLKAQNKITKYYDANWGETAKEKAMFYADFIKDANYYSCTSYWLKSNRVRGKSTFEDTTMMYPVGTQVLYFENGHVEDSSFYKDHHIKYSFHYYPNNQLESHYFLPDNKKEGVAEGYDESGKRIRKYIFGKDAEFKGGEKGWVAYIQKNVSKDLTVKGDKEVKATVQVQFIVDENGYVTMAKIRQSSGYKNVDEDALRVISNSPNWKNAIEFNKPVKVYKFQPLTYILLPEKK